MLKHVAKRACQAHNSQAMLLASQRILSSGKAQLNTAPVQQQTVSPPQPSAMSAMSGVTARWSDVPAPAKLLGLAGVIPFLALSPPIAASLPLPADLVQHAALLQVAYGANIASFLGGIHWAMAMAEYGGKQANQQMGTDRYVWSVMPCLMAWPAVAMAPGPASLVVASVLGVVHAVDSRFAGQKLLPAWYMVLRRPLSALAISGMLVTLGGSFITSDDVEVREASHTAANKQPSP